MRGPEAIIQDDNVAYAESIGLLCVKLRIVGERSWPDYLFFARDGRVIFVEYKAPGEGPRKAQEDKHALLKRYGHDVKVIDNAQTGRELLRQFSKPRGYTEEQRAAIKSDLDEKANRAFRIFGGK